MIGSFDQDLVQFSGKLEIRCMRAFRQKPNWDKESSGDLISEKFGGAHIAALGVSPLSGVFAQSGAILA